MTVVFDNNDCTVIAHEFLYFLLLLLYLSRSLLLHCYFVFVVHYSKNREECIRSGEQSITREGVYEYITNISAVQYGVYIGVKTCDFSFCFIPLLSCTILHSVVSVPFASFVLRHS